MTKFFVIIKKKKINVSEKNKVAIIKNGCINFIELSKEIKTIAEELKNPISIGNINFFDVPPYSKIISF